MIKRRGKGVLSLTYVFASFFGAAMIAGAYAYFNYKFSQYNFLDFNQYVFYEKKDLFNPTSEEYVVVVFSSNINSTDKIKSFYKDTDILAIDLYQKRFLSDDNVTFISGGMNTLLKFIQRFNIYEVPSAFLIKRVKNGNYKQDSAITILK